MKKQEILLGNGAIALGLLEAGCQVVTSYPGTPSSEILPEVIRLVKSENLNTYVEWSTNEKVALDNAFAASITGKRAACCMKQVGLNVAADSLMSAAYLGTVGGLVIISCDDPGSPLLSDRAGHPVHGPLGQGPCPGSFQSGGGEEDGRARLDLSEEFRVPVILRPAIRVCHARQNIAYDSLPANPKKSAFEKDPLRWAATPRFRLILHGELNKKLKEIGKRFDTLSQYNFHNLEPGRKYPLGIIAGGVPYAVIRDILEEEKRTDLPVLKLGTPYPLPEALASDFMGACDKVLVIEETDTLIEYLLGDRNKVLGRLSGHVPLEGELVPQVIYRLLDRTLRELKLQGFEGEDDTEAMELVKSLKLPVRRPTLCPGCPHRAAFFAIRKSRPKAIFTSDIGCYTLGMNLGVVDTCLDMGAAITMASGFYHAFTQDGVDQPIVATIGDSTFYHSGTAGLLNAVYNGSRFILVILDNLTTAMTGMQPSPSMGIRADGSEGKAISLERIVAGCGIDFIEVLDPYDIKKMTEVLKKAAEYIQEPEGGIAVVIARHPCLIAYRAEAIPEKKKVMVTEECAECNFCMERFECPAIYHDQELGRTSINAQLCSSCGVCTQICPKGAIVEVA